MVDALGNRMKENYENRSRFFLPRRTYTIIRLDGKAFHTYTRKLKKPYDETLLDSFDEVTKVLCKDIQGVAFGYTQSDEISLLLTDFNTPKTDAWFNGNVQKITSISAAMAAVNFMKVRQEKYADNRLAYFDSRVFSIPDVNEVINYFIWRQQDAVRNSIQMLAQSLYSHHELNKKKTNELQELIFQKGINWDSLDSRLKRGTVIYRVAYEVSDKKEGFVTRHKWVPVNTPIFTQNKYFLKGLIPVYENNF